jgi:hypothetical protein
MNSKKFTSNDIKLAEIISDWDAEERGVIIFNAAIKYLENKYKDCFHKKTGESYVTITSKEPSFWEWYARIVNIMEKELIQNVEYRNMIITMEVYQKSMEAAENVFNINKSVTYTKHKLTNKII